MRRKTIRVQPAVDADGLCASQTPGAAGALDLDGALIVGGAWSSSIGQLVTITADGDESARTFTVTGTDYNGYAITEDIAGPNATTGTGAVYFYGITEISVDDATADALTVGFAGGAVSPPFTVNYKMPDFKAALGVDVSGTINWTIQYTFDDVFATAWRENTGDWDNHDDSNLVSQTVDRSGNYAYPPVATRIKVNSVTSPGYVDFTVIVPA